MYTPSDSHKFLMTVTQIPYIYNANVRLVADFHVE